MNILDFFISASTNLFRIYLNNRFVSVFFGNTEKNKRKIVLVCFCFWVANTLLYWEFHTVWINVLCNLIGISAMVLLYTKSVKTNIFVTSAVYIVNCACDIASRGFFVSFKDGEIYSEIYAVVMVFLFFLCELLSEKIITHRINAEETQNFPLIFVPLCSIALIVLLTYLNVCSSRGIAIVSIVLLVINFFMLYLYNLLQRSISDKYEAELLRQEVQIYANQLNVIRRSEEKVRAIRHDMKHHMNEIKLLANQNRTEEIQDYIDHMEAYIQNPDEIVSSGNMEIDSVLNYMLQRAKKELETVNVKIMLPEKVKHSFDVNVLIGNLLENAIEAAKQTKEKYLGVNIAIKRGVLKIQVENSYLPSNLVEEGHQDFGGSFASTKKQKDQHGIGLKSVKKIVEDHNGVMEVTPQDNIFHVNLILYMT